MGKYRVEYLRKECIGAGVCAAMDPENFEMNADGLADLKDSNQEGDIFVKEVDNLEEIKEAADGCPVRIIKVIEKETGKVISPPE